MANAAWQLPAAKWQHSATNTTPELPEMASPPRQIRHSEAGRTAGRRRQPCARGMPRRPERPARPSSRRTGETASCAVSASPQRLVSSPDGIFRSLLFGTGDRQRERSENYTVWWNSDRGVGGCHARATAKPVSLSNAPRRVPIEHPPPLE